MCVFPVRRKDGAGVEGASCPPAIGYSHLSFSPCFSFSDVCWPRQAPLIEPPGKWWNSPIGRSSRLNFLCRFHEASVELEDTAWRLFASIFEICARKGEWGRGSNEAKGKNVFVLVRRQVEIKRMGCHCKDGCEEKSSFGCHLISAILLSATNTWERCITTTEDHYRFQIDVVCPITSVFGHPWRWALPLPWIQGVRYSRSQIRMDAYHFSPDILLLGTFVSTFNWIIVFLSEISFDSTPFFFYEGITCRDAIILLKWGTGREIPLSASSCYSGDANRLRRSVDPVYCVAPGSHGLRGDQRDIGQGADWYVAGRLGVSAWSGDWAGFPATRRSFLPAARAPIRACSINPVPATTVYSGSSISTGL